MAGFSLDTSGFMSGRELNAKMRRAVKGTLQYHRPGAEEYMKHNAPWKDRTTNARNGLGARVRGRGNTYALVLFHSADYGIYLELPHTHERADGTEYTIGPYPIILPTIDEFGPRVRATFVGLMDRLDAMARRGRGA